MSTNCFALTATGVSRPGYGTTSSGGFAYFLHSGNKRRVHKLNAVIPNIHHRLESFFVTNGGAPNLVSLGENPSGKQPSKDNRCR